MDQKKLESAGAINQSAGICEEKWSNGLESLKFPQPLVSSVRRPSLTQQFEADFMRHLRLISPAATMYVKAVTAGVSRIFCLIIEETSRPQRRIGLEGPSRKNGTVVRKTWSMCNSSQWEFHKSAGTFPGC